MGNNILNKKINYFSTKNSNKNILKLEEPRNNINNYPIKKIIEEDNYQNRNDIILSENKTSPKTNNNYNININNYNKRKKQ